MNAWCESFTVVGWMCHVLRRGKRDDGVMKVGAIGRMKKSVGWWFLATSRRGINRSTDGE